MNISLKLFSQILRNGQPISRKFTSLPGNTMQLSNLKIYYEKVGNEKQQLFLMPGALGFSRMDFAMHMEKLNHNKFTVVTWDPPGYGYSRPPNRQFSINYHYKDAQLAVDLLKNLGIKKTNVIGWSDGGATAFIVAALNPDLVDKLVVFGAPSFVSEKDIENYEAVRDISKWSDRMKKPMVDMYGEDYLQLLWNQWIDIRIQIYNENHGDICKTLLKFIKCPTLIIYGKQDPIVPRFHHIFANEMIANSTLIEWDNAKHNLHMKYVDKFIETVERFILS